MRPVAGHLERGQVVAAGPVGVMQPGIARKIARIGLAGGVRMEVGSLGGILTPQVIGVLADKLGFQAAILFLVLDAFLLALFGASTRVLHALSNLHWHNGSRIGSHLSSRHSSLSHHLSSINRRSIRCSTQHSEQHQCSDAQRGKGMASNKYSHSSCNFTYQLQAKPHLQH
jgi:hypothetical protein